MAGGSVDGVPVAVWGLTFKARTDDLRDSPALAGHRPAAGAGRRGPGLRPGRSRPQPRVAGLDGIEVAADPYAACDGAAVLVVLTEWDEFRRLDFAKVAELLRRPRSSTPATCSTRAAAAAPGLRLRGRSVDR